MRVTVNLTAEAIRDRDGTRDALVALGLYNMAYYSISQVYKGSIEEMDLEALRASPLVDSVDVETK